MRVVKFILSGELIFFLFIISGAFKAAIPKFPFDLTLFLMVLSMVIALVKFIRGQQIYKAAIKTPLIVYFSLAILVLVSVYYSESSVYALEKTLKFISITLWSLFGGFFLIKDEQSLNKFIKGILLSIVVIAGFSLFDYVKNYNPVTQFRYGFEGSPLTLAQVSSLGSLISIVLVLFSTKKYLKLMYFVLFLVLTFTSLVTGSRMPIISSVIAILPIILLSIKFTRHNIVYKKGTFAFVLLIFVIVGTFQTNSSIDSFRNFNARFEMLFSSQLDDSSAERINRYKYAWKMFGESPFIGNGIGSFAINYTEKDIREYPHNIFIEILAETGLLGFLLFTTLLFNGIKRAIKGLRRKTTPEKLILISAFLYAFLNANISGDLNDNRMLFCFLGILYMFPYIFKTKKTIKEVYAASLDDTTLNIY